MTSVPATNGAEQRSAGKDVSMIGLAADIARQATRIHEYLQGTEARDLSEGGGSIDPPETAEYALLRNQLTSSLEDLQHLIDGPRTYLRSFICSGNDLAALQVGFDFNFFTIVPEEGDIGISELADKAGLDVDRASRVVRMMITRRLFQEAIPGRIAHTTGSRIFKTDENLRCAGQYMLDEMWKAATASSDCIKASPHESDIDRQISELQDNYPWADLKGTVVDVGGGSGHVSVALARLFPHLSFTVQDASPHMIAQGQSLDLSGVEGRVFWMQHDFFQPQPVRDAGAFVVRQCLHNWCDRDVITIFKSLVPGLEGSAPGTPLLINDTLLPEPNKIPAHVERSMRQMDMLMFVAVGSKERTKDDFEMLLKEADPRFEIHRVLAEGSMGLIEVHLRR
ncbi:hypothetical protein S40293_03967 [Stachybotrys chartarum IBT 40293]|nr:hypothetical protein S40293_03967 [Stachybotrys chartarum IBT 40293]